MEKVIIGRSRGQRPSAIAIVDSYPIRDMLWITCRPRLRWKCTGRALGRAWNPSCKRLWLVCDHRHLIEASERPSQMQKQSTNQRHAEQDERHLRAESGTGITNWPTAADVAAPGFKFYWCKLYASGPVISFQPSCVRVIWATTRSTPIQLELHLDFVPLFCSQYQQALRRSADAW